MPAAALGAMGYCYMWWKVILFKAKPSSVGIAFGIMLESICKLLFFSFTLYFSNLQGWSFSDVMFVTKSNMANAVATVSKQLEHVSETLAVSRIFFSYM